MEKWVGKVAIVTGASAGIGAATAAALVKAGINVVGLARRKERVDQLAAELKNEPGKLYGFKTDITKEEEILEAFKWTTENVGPVSILINNAGIVQVSTLHNGETEKWKKVLDTNVLGVAIASREAIKIMNENKIDGYIININSVAGHVVIDMPSINVYSPSKFALTSMTETLRFELARLKSNIRVTVVGLARRKERIDQLSAELKNEPGKLYGFKTDISKEEEILEAFRWTTENVGPVSILINNAGIAQMTNLHDGETEKWKKVLDTNVLGVAIASREAIKIMNEHKIDGYIININSIAGHIVLDFPNLNIYSASKFALTSMTETLRFELARLKSNIRVTNLSPGGVHTEFAVANELITEEVYKGMIANSNRPILESRDVADAILYLLSTPLRVQVTELTIRPIRERNSS